MGVRQENYIILGADIGMEHYNDECYEDYEAYYDRQGDIFYLVDGMSGRYFIVGKVLKFGDYYEGMPRTVFDLNNEELYKEQSKLITQHIKDKFNLDVEPKLHVLTHWS